MSRAEERQKKFHDSLLRILYPPPESPPPQQPDEVKQLISSYPPVHEVENAEEDSSESSSDEEVDTTQKLTRAQRKKIRKKKLKESAFRRSNIIGPLLATEYGKDGSSSEIANNPSGSNPTTQISAVESKKNKLKRRRRAKTVSEGKGISPGDGNDCA